MQNPDYRMVRLLYGRVKACGWWYGLYWVTLDGGTCVSDPILWFSGPLEAITFLSLA